MPPSPQIDAGTIDIIVDAYEHGVSIQQIAKRIGLSRSTVWKYLERSGVKRRPAGRPPSKPGAPPA